MGQQQIFLLIVVFIIVTIAVIVALNLGSGVQLEFQEDQYSQVMLEIGELFQATYEKPELFGGGNHDWFKVSFVNVPCSFGNVFDAKGHVCRSENGELVILLKPYSDRINIHAIAHIGGSGLNDMYTREMEVDKDSVVFRTDWIPHQ